MPGEPTSRAPEEQSGDQTADTEKEDNEDGRQETAEMPARFQETPDHVYNAQQQAYFNHYAMNGGGFFPNGSYANGFYPVATQGPLPPPPADSPEAIVVSGISGRFPESANLDEFTENLFAGVDMVTESDRRWKPGLLGLPKRLGSLKDIKTFDATFFGVHGKQADQMDPQLRMLLEVTYEALLDAGVNPELIRGTNTGVYIGASVSEAETAYNTPSDPDEVSGYTLTGCCRAMFANRVSFTFDFNGPSYAIDTACSSSLLAFQHAFDAIKNGECDAAIVGGVNLCLKPQMSLNFHKMSMLSPDGACKAFDKSGNGYVRSEAAVVVYLQKKKDARRVYATILNARTNCDGFKPQGVTYPSGEMQKKLLLETYAEADIDPTKVFYVEAHGTGTKVGDPQELNAISDVFCKNRTQSLLVGSVKSNMGHSEPASGLCALAKILIAMEKGAIPPNLHFKEANPDIPALVDGRLEVVDKAKQFPHGGIAGLNCFGFGGANVHVILQSHRGMNVEEPAVPAIPRLVHFSGRTEEAVQQTLELLEKTPMDLPHVTLLQEIFSTTVPGHPYRGFSLLGATDSARTVEHVSNTKRPIWFCYAGMGTQWVGMGRDLFKLPCFDETIRKCSDALVPYGMDLYNLLLNGTENECNNTMNAFVAIAAVQVALTETLITMGIHPDGIVGHSVGELCCAYADGTLTAEQTVSAAYWRGRCIVEANLPAGAMAAVGLSWEEAKKRCPPSIYPACHNAADNVTISGPTEDVKNFVAELTAEGIFAREVNSGGMAFHSEYIAAAGPQLKRALQQVIPIPKARSSRWISSSISEPNWNTPLASSSSAAYHVNNLLSPVLFQEALKHIPENAIIVEIAPHSLLQAILKRSLAHKSCSVLPTQKRGHEDNLHFFLNNIGKLYLAGGPSPKLQKLYQGKEKNYPVPRGTRGIGSLVQWDHAVEWKVPTLEQFGFSDSSGSASDFKATITLDSGTEYAHVVGHRIDGRVLFPATGYLFLAWKALARSVGVPVEELPVAFKDVHLHRATILNASAGPVTLGVSLLKTTGRWEICDGDSQVATGFISVPENKSLSYANLVEKEQPKTDGVSVLDRKEVYRELLLRGYEYKEDFRGIVEASLDGKFGKLAWKNNWIAFMDTMLQLSLMSESSRSLKLPTRIRHIKVNPELQMQAVQGAGEASELPAFYDKYLQVCIAGGVEIQGMKASVAPRRPPAHGPPTLESYTLFELFPEKPVASNCVERALLDIVLQNTTKSKLTFLQFPAVGTDFGKAETVRTVRMKEVAERMPYYVDCLVVSAKKADAQQFASIAEDKLAADKYDLVVVETANVTSKAWNCVAPGGFLLVWSTGAAADVAGCCDFVKIASLPLADAEGLVLMFRKQVATTVEAEFLDVTESQTFSWVDELKVSAAKLLSQKNSRLWLTASSDCTNGIVGLANCIRKEPGLENTRCIFSSGANLDKSSKEVQDIVNKDLATNVMIQGLNGKLFHCVFVHDDLEGSQPERLVSHAYLNATVKGDLSSLAWVESPLGIPGLKKPNQVLCNVYYAPLNFRDIMLATGKLPPDALPGNLATQECVLGLEFAGREAPNGRRVMGLVPAQGLATTVLADPDFMWTVPESWTLKEASTVPVVYATAYYALVVRGRLQPGESVLIHAGSGGVGQAAIQIALSMGCTVYTTVGSDSKKEFLKDRFPALTDNSFGNSRDAVSFETWIMRQTKGKGVDMALNSLAGDKLMATVRCIAEHGRFLEIGKYDLSENTPLGMAIFLKNITFHGILLDALFDVPEEKKRVVGMVAEGIKNGVVRSLPASVFDQTQSEAAFRFMSCGKHMGKVVLEVQPEEEKGAPTNGTQVLAIPRVYCKPGSVYLITGGLGGFGLELAHWLVSKGAKNIVLTSRSGIKTGFQHRAITSLESKGAKIYISTTSTNSTEGTEALIAECITIGPLAAIFHLAVVIRDGILNNQTADEFKQVYGPKALSLINLDQVSREKNLALDWFVAFSSVSCGRGNAGQTNYGLANSVQERICEKRKQDGLPGLAIQWGAIGDVGVVLDLLGDNDTVVGGSLPQRMPSCLQTLETFLCLSEGKGSPAVVASTVWAKKSEGPAGASASSKGDVCQQIAKIIGISNVSTINQTATLGDLGMDSLMVVEVRQALERECDLNLSIPEVRQLTFAGLKELQAGQEEAPASIEPIDEAPVLDKVLKPISMRSFLTKETVVEFVPDNEEERKKPAVFLLPPIEGTVDSLSNLAKALKRPVYGLQVVAGVKATSIPKLAEQFIAIIQQIQPEGPYGLIGYSFGATVAFEVALQFGPSQVTDLLLIDGSHAYVATLTKRYINRLDNTDEWHASQICAFLSQFAAFNIEKMRASLLKAGNWENMLAKLAGILKTVEVSASVEELNQAVTSFGDRLLAGINYQPSGKFSGKVTLLKAAQNEAAALLPSDYRLSEVCNGAIDVHEISGDHFTCVSTLAEENASRVQEALNEQVSNKFQPKMVNGAA